MYVYTYKYRMLYGFLRSGYRNIYVILFAKYTYMYMYMCNLYIVYRFVQKYSLQYIPYISRPLLVSHTPYTLTECYLSPSQK